MNIILNNILKEDLKQKIAKSEFYKAAFTHKSYSNENNLEYSYERLEFLGDSILGAKVTTFIWEQFPDMNEGELTSLRSKVVRQETLAAATLSLGLQDYLFLGNGEKITGGQQRVSILSDIFESFLAAVFLDLGNEAVDKILHVTLYEWIIDNSLNTIIDYKTKLQEYIQNEKRDPIIYKQLEQIKKDNFTYFIIGVYLDNLLMGKGQGTTKKKAEQEAAKNALKKLSKKVSK